MTCQHSIGICENRWRTDGQPCCFDCRHTSKREFTGTCQPCGAQTPDGLTLCNRCKTTASIALTNIAAYYADLDRVPTTSGGRRRNGDHPDPTGLAASIVADGVSDAYDDAENTLSTWCRCLADDRPQAGGVPSDLAPQAAWLEKHLSSVATLAWAGDMLRDLTRLEKRLRKIASGAETGWYAGPCGSLTVYGDAVIRCERVLYAAEGEPFVRCRDCGSTWDVRARRRELVQQAEDELVPLRVLAHLAAVMTDETSIGKLEARIQQWVQRKKLTAVTTKVIDNRARHVYRVGDVLDLLAG